MRTGYALVSWLSRSAFKLLFRVEIRGMEHLPLTGKLIIAANHQSYLDPPLLGGVIPREIYFLAKAQLFKKPVLGPLIRYLNSVPVNRSGLDLETLRTAQQILHNGGALLIFPEGTRSRTGEFLKPTGGIGWLVRQTNAPVLPVYIQGTRGAEKRPFHHPRITVIVSPLVQVSDFDREFGSGSEGYRKFSSAIPQQIAAAKSAAEPP